MDIHSVPSTHLIQLFQNKQEQNGRIRNQKAEMGESQDPKYRPQELQKSRAASEKAQFGINQVPKREWRVYLIRALGLVS